MSYQVHIARNMRGDLFAETNIEFGAGRLLRISTHKSSRGMVCSAIAGQATAGNCFMYAPFSDFSRTLAADRAARCTEKTVRTMHAAGLAQVAELLQAAAAHYNPAAQFAAVPA